MERRELMQHEKLMLELMTLCDIWVLEIEFVEMSGTRVGRATVMTTDKQESQKTE